MAYKSKYLTRNCIKSMTIVLDFIVKKNNSLSHYLEISTNLVLIVSSKQFRIALISTSCKKFNRKPIPDFVSRVLRNYGHARIIVETMAEFVAKNGPEFESRIIDTNAGNDHFNFLNQLDPYHAYYQHRDYTLRIEMKQITSYLFE
ncbi:hypothetical protein P8452_40304 [Trifolium repens]|nr:hypothetical protein P8452_40304 [Trifolium repens]